MRHHGVRRKAIIETAMNSPELKLQAGELPLGTQEHEGRSCTTEERGHLRLSGPR